MYIKPNNCTCSFVWTDTCVCYVCKHHDTTLVERVEQSDDHSERFLMNESSGSRQSWFLHRANAHVYMCQMKHNTVVQLGKASEAMLCRWYQQGFQQPRMR